MTADMCVWATHKSWALTNFLSSSAGDRLRTGRAVLWATDIGMWRVAAALLLVLTPAEVAGGVEGGLAAWATPNSLPVKLDSFKGSRAGVDISGKLVAAALTFSAEIHRGMETHGHFAIVHEYIHILIGEAILLGVAVAKERCDSRAVASGAQVSLLCTSGAVLAALWVKATERCSLAEVVTDLRSFCRALCATHKQVMCERGTVE